MQRICRFVGWILAVAIFVLSVVPPSGRPTTGVPHNMEHLLIFLAMGLAFAVGYRNRLPAVAGGLVLFCGAIEVVQIWVPGRHARLSDFLVDVAATGLGVAAVVAATWILPRRSAQ
jgi:VanZ family protein